MSHADYDLTRSTSKHNHSTSDQDLYLEYKTLAHVFRGCIEPWAKVRNLPLPPVAQEMQKYLETYEASKKV